ncbi:MAG: hypothetical protein GQ570_08840 [Helicobacteraceae bacterium]|nr:hypothetical protein [Helicobacteraceae bacterium]
MNKHLEQIINLSKIDKEISAFEPRLEEANAKYNTIIFEKDELSSQIEKLEDEIKSEKLKSQKNELHLAELSAKLEENSKKSASIKSEREMKSLQLEEEIAKEQVSFANEEIERLGKVIDIKNELITELKTKMDEVEEKLTPIKAEVDKAVVSIEKDRKKVFSKKEKLMGEMEQKGVAFYQKVRRWASDSAAVELKNQACMGCFMLVNDKIYSEVIKGEEIVTCPHCGRIIYLDEATAS